MGTQPAGVCWSRRQPGSMPPLQPTPCTRLATRMQACRSRGAGRSACLDELYLVVGAPAPLHNLCGALGVPPQHDAPHAAKRAGACGSRERSVKGVACGVQGAAASGMAAGLWDARAQATATQPQRSAQHSAEHAQQAQRAAHPARWAAHRAPTGRQCRSRSPPPASMKHGAARAAVAATRVLLPPPCKPPGASWRVVWHGSSSSSRGLAK